MKNETEIIEYLKAHNLLKDEGTHPEELLAQITIRAFDELAEYAQGLQDDLDIVDDELLECKGELEDANNKLTEIKEIVNDNKNDN